MKQHAAISCILKIPQENQIKITKMMILVRRKLNLDGLKSYFIRILAFDR